MVNTQTPAGIRTPFDTPPDEGEVVEVADGVLWIRLPLPMALDHVNCYAIDEGDSWAIIDTGFSSKRGRAIWQKLLDGPLSGKPIGRVIVTHHHPDHVGLAGWFMERGAELWMPRTGWLMARMLTLDEQPSYPAETLDFYRRAGMDADVLAQRMTERPFNFADCVAPLPLGYRRLIEGEVIHLGGRDWDVRMGDGHAPEHLTLWAQDGTLVIGGDQLLHSISPNLGVYPTEPDADPVGDWLAACERLAPHATDTQLILGGHKLPFTGLPLRMRQFVDNHHHALDRLLAYLDTEKVAGACFVPLFKREITGSAYGLALVETVGHLNHLWRLGQVTRRLDADGAYYWKAV